MSNEISDTNLNTECESGWTMYLDQPLFSENEFNRDGGIIGEDHSKKESFQEEEEEEEEDLSMVSDASSGPPFYPEYCFRDDGSSSYPSWVSESAIESKQKKTTTKKKNRINDHGRSQQYSYLDDTASSTKKKGLNYSQSFSAATHMKGKSSSTKHFGFFGSSIEKKTPPEE